MSTTLQFLFILLFIQCFTLISSLAQIISNIPITDTTTLNERVIQTSNYQEDSILLRLVNQTDRCSENQVKLKLIGQDGSINTRIIRDDRILGENFCIPLLLADREFEGFMALDGIRLYALKPPFTLLTYLCNIEQGTSTSEICGQLINWDNENIMGNEINFGQTCTYSTIVIQDQIDGDMEFLRACYLSDQSSLIWNRYIIDRNNQTINGKDSGTISNFNITFTPNNRPYLFPTEGGGYGIVTYRSIHSVQFGGSSEQSFYLDFIPSSSSSKNFDMGGPFQLYRPNLPITALNIFKCVGSNMGIGYSCIIYLNNNLLVNIDFLDSGSILSTNEFPNLNPNVNNIDSLYYGGYVVLTGVTSVITGSIYSNNGDFIDFWPMPPMIDGVLITYVGNVGVFNNNTIWTIGNSIQGLKLITSTIPNSPNEDNESINRLLNFGNPFIESVTIDGVIHPNLTGAITIPTNNNTINISIKYVALIELSNGNFSIWQSWNDNDQDILRQSFSGNQFQFVRLGSDSMTVDITVFGSTFNVPGAQYYVKIDNGFVKDLRTGQDLIGIRKNRWTFNTETNTGDIGTGTASAIMRLSPVGTMAFKKYTNKEKDNFLNVMSEELAKIIPIEPIEQAKLSTRKHYQFDTNSHDDQILLRVDVKVANNGGLVGVVNSWRVVNDLNTLIANKEFTGIGRGSCVSLLDNTYGSINSPNLWKLYWWILIIVGAILAIVLFLFRLARRSRKGRNYVIFMFTILAVDFGLDVAFVIIHGHDLKWLYPASVVFLAFPILVNSIVTFMIVTRETTSNENKEFSKWWRRNPKIALFFTLFSIIDIEGLNVISSGYAGYDRFNAPISDKSSGRILIVNAVVKFLEDIPQFIIYVIYLIYTVVPAIIPILALSTCSAVIIIKSTNIIWFGLCYPPPRSYYNLTQHKKAKMKDDLLATVSEYKPRISDTTPPKLFSSNNDSSTPDSAVVHTTENGETKFSIRNPTEMETLKNLPIQTVGKPVSQSIVKVDEGEESGITGDRRSERKSDTGIIGTTESIVPISVEPGEDTERRGRRSSEPMEVLKPGNVSGDNTIQGPSVYQSRLIEQIDLESEPPPQRQQQQQQQPPSPSTSSIRTFVSGAVRSFSSIGGSSRKGSLGSKKGKAKEDDDQKDQDKGDDGS